MGSWDTGNFDNDNAADFLDDFVEDLVKTIVYGLAQSIYRNKRYEYTETLVSVDVLALVCRQYKKSPGIKDQVVDTWQQLYLEILDETDEKYVDDTIPNYKEQRRKLAAECFNRLRDVTRLHPPYD